MNLYSFKRGIPNFENILHLGVQKVSVSLHELLIRHHSTFSGAILLRQENQ